MKSFILLLALLLTNEQLYQCETELDQTNRQLEDFQSYIGRKIVRYFNLHALTILESKSLNETGKKILLKYLFINLMHMKRKFVESSRMRLEKTKKKIGNYMHWRHG